MGRTQRFRIFNRDGFRCKYCGRRGSDEAVQLEVDHVVPRSRGGLDEDSNLVTSCFDCNRGKRDTMIVDQNDDEPLGPELEECLRTGDHATAIEIMGGDLEVAKRLRTFQKERAMVTKEDPVTIDGQSVSVWVHSGGHYVMLSFGKAEKTIVFEFHDAERLGEQLVAAGKQGAAIMFPNKKSDPESPPPIVPRSDP